MTVTESEFAGLAPLNHRAALLAELEAAKRERQRLTALIAALEFCLQCPYCNE
jgi:hypothetical protein